MAKKYSIRLELLAQQAIAQSQQANAALGSIATTSTQAAQTVQKNAAKTADAQAAATQKVAEIEARWLKKEQDDRLAWLRKKGQLAQQAADRDAAQAKRAADAQVRESARVQAAAARAYSGVQKRRDSDGLNDSQRAALRHKPGVDPDVVEGRINASIERYQAQEQALARLEPIARRAAELRIQLARKAADVEVAEANRAARGAELAEARKTQAAAQAAVDEARSAIDAAHKSEMAAKQAGDAQAAAAARAAATDGREKLRSAINAEDLARKQVAAATRAADQSERVHERSAKSFERTAEYAARASVNASEQSTRGLQIWARATETLATQLSGVAMQYVGIQAIGRVMAEIGKATKEAADHQQRLAEEAIRYRDTQREIQSMIGGTADTKAALKAAQFETRTGLDQGEAKSFQTAFYGAGAQFEGRTIGKPEFERYKTLTASLAASKGISPDVMGELAGRVLGYHGDLEKKAKKHKTSSADLALGEFNQGMSILQHGTGGNAELLRNSTQLAAAFLNDDETKGVFKDFKEVATVISAAAEINPQESEVYARSAVRALRRFDHDKMGPVLKAAGVTHKTGFTESMTRVGKYAEAEARRKGVKIQDIFKSLHLDEREVKALSAFTSKAIGPEGIFAEREAYAKTVEGAGPAYAEMNAARRDPHSAVSARIAEAQEREGKLSRGYESTLAVTLKKQAMGQLEKERGINTTDTNITDFLLNLATLPSHLIGRFDSHRQRQEFRVLENLEKRARAAGIPGISAKQLSRQYDGTPESFDALINRVAKKFEAHGANPLGDLAIRQPGQQDAAGNAALAAALHRNAAALDRNTQVVQQQRAGQQAGVAPAGPKAVIPAPLGPPRQPAAGGGLRP